LAFFENLKNDSFKEISQIYQAPFKKISEDLPLPKSFPKEKQEDFLAHANQA
jgi:hypothetical protein